MNDKTNEKDEDRPDEKAAVTLPAVVEKIIPPITPNQPEKAQIAVEGAEDLSKGVSLQTVSTLLGHSSTKMTERRYSHWIKGRQEKLEDELRKSWSHSVAVAPVTPQKTSVLKGK